MADSGQQDAEGLLSFLEGAILGDFSDDTTWSRIGGQTVIGFLPVVGQIADARDTLAAIKGIWDGKEGGWGDLGLAALAWVPALGDLAKGALRFDRKAAKAAAEGAEALEQGAKHAGDVAVPVATFGSGKKASLLLGPSKTLVGTNTHQFRRDAERLIRETEDHPLKFLLGPDGRFGGTRGLEHHELYTRPDLVQMGHVLSNKSGGPERVVLQDAWGNQFDNITMEHPSKKGTYRQSAEVVDIGGIAVDRRTAKMWQDYGMLKGVDVGSAPVVPF